MTSYCAIQVTLGLGVLRPCMLYCYTTPPLYYLFRVSIAKVLVCIDTDHLERQYLTNTSQTPHKHLTNISQTPHEQLKNTSQTTHKHLTKPRKEIIQPTLQHSTLDGLKAFKCNADTQAEFESLTCESPGASCDLKGDI